MIKKNYKSGIQCHYCKKFGHMKTDCWKREKQASYMEKNEENSKLFMTHSYVHNISNDIWFLDSRCSNHMSGIKSIFRDIDETHKLNVRLEITSRSKWKGKEQLR